MRKTLISIAAAAATAGALMLAPVASADLDPHMPIPGVGFCPGGGSDMVFGGYCEGMSYPDGTRWQYVAGWAPFVGHFWTGPNCIFWTGNPLPPLAPANGCARF